MRFSKREIDALSCPPGKRDALFSDTETKGFLVRVTDTGAKLFLFQYRYAGKVRRLKLGEYGALTIAQARKLAEEARGRVLAGGDPVGERRAEVVSYQASLQEQAAQAAIDALTLDLLIDRWAAMALREHSETYRREGPQRIRYNFQSFLSRPAQSLTVSELQARLDEIAERHPTTARRLQAYARAMYAWAVKRQLVEDNPFARLIVEGREVSRDRVLTDEEIGEIWRAAGQMAYPFGPFFRLLLLTLQRRAEVAEMRWEEISPDLTTWTIPAERTKNSRAHIVHLSEPARHVLAALHRQTDPKIGAISPYVFTNTGRTPISDFSGAKERLERLIEVERAEKSPGKEVCAMPAPGWRLHDLRRTGVTVMARLGVGPHVADRVLNHVQGTIKGVAAVYQRHEFLKEREIALDNWAAHVLLVTRGEASFSGVGAQVIQLRS
ncbi:tyrosine-type recombinase/integrase [Gluconobacter thailandicus]|uniref:tyrosine-type recombinase/integrase n=1 Tax=Gluconobacter thailandicus TaxID=257438 RepID=UPI0002F1643E|nr:site-specific integrase [Gluconobacter thailandicus]